MRAGAQNMHEQDSGAFTGEVSAPMLLELGVEAVVLGHSERRQHFGETDAALARKVPKALEAGLLPILCVGETEEEREAGETERKLRQQVQSDLAAVEVARAARARDRIRADLGDRDRQDRNARAGPGRDRLRARARRATAMPPRPRAVRILYGGSVDAANAAELMGLEDIDGALVGGRQPGPGPLPVDRRGRQAVSARPSPGRIRRTCRFRRSRS